MSATGLCVFDSTIHQTNTWLKSLFEPLDTENRHRAYLALRVKLHALRDRLPPELAVHFGAQLPMLGGGGFSSTLGDVQDDRCTRSGIETIIDRLEV